MPLLAALAMLSTTTQHSMTPFEVLSGSVRVQAITPWLVRIEEKGPKGYEDRNTFTVVHREKIQERRDPGGIDLGEYQLVVPEHATATDVCILDRQGKVVFHWDGKKVPHRFLPGPGEPFVSYVISDNPRIVPPAWGATPQPDSNKKFRSTSGWDVGNDATDLYVFLRGPEGYANLRKDYLDLTGRTPLPPLAAFGFWDSRWVEYTEKSALDQIDEYRAKGYPIDFFVVDTDWRINGSHGYEVEKKDFPDMERFIAEAHKRHVHLMYNDHPEPVAKAALEPKELEYRWSGLTELLNWGADVWWYDRNWMTHLHEPAPGISKEVWGASMFHDMTLRSRPERRPLIMSNVEGIDNGKRNYAPHPAFHRYPVWWTGDTGAYWSYLQSGIANGVDSGVISLLPYVNEDLGGHWAHPTPELYVRYLQYGTLSPLTRIHCTKGEDRHPWIFGAEAEAIVKDYIKMRYRLLPTIYAAARRAYEDGTPLLRRCDLEWPQFAEAADNQQYLFGDDILVAPTNESVIPPATSIPGAMLRTADGKPGLTGEYFANTELRGAPKITRIDPFIDFDWKSAAPVKGLPKENFSIRWHGTLGPVPETGDYRLVARVDDGVRLFLDGKQLLNDWTGHAETAETSLVHLETGKTYDLRLEYLQLGYEDSCHLEWVLPSEAKTVATRSLWIPPGEWEDVWTGETLSGPKRITVQSPLWHTPMYVRRGGVVLQVPQMNYTSERPWDTVVADIYPSQTPTKRFLYEDDGSSNGYISGAFRVTALDIQQNGRSVMVHIPGSKGTCDGAATQRTWLLRVHLNGSEEVSKATLNGNVVPCKTIHAAKERVSMPFLGEGSAPGPQAGNVIEVQIPRGDVLQDLKLLLDIQ